MVQPEHSYAFGGAVRMFFGSFETFSILGFATFAIHPPVNEA